MSGKIKCSKFIISEFLDHSDSEILSCFKSRIKGWTKLMQIVC